jgi:hypothetical protein
MINIYNQITMTLFLLHNLQTWSSLGEILVSTVTTLNHIHARASLWRKDTATSFLTWWINELRRSVADSIERGLIEMERLDGGLFKPYLPSI